MRTGLLLASSSGTVCFYDDIKATTMDPKVLSIPLMPGETGLTLVDVQPIGFILGLNSGRLCRLDIKSAPTSRQSTVSATMLSSRQKGMMQSLTQLATGFLGRQMMEHENLVAIAVGTERAQQFQKDVFVLTEKSIQRRSFLANASERILYDHHLYDIICRSIAFDFSEPNQDISQETLYHLDVQFHDIDIGDDNQPVLLVSFLDPRQRDSKQRQYVIMFLSFQGSAFQTVTEKKYLSLARNVGSSDDQVVKPKLHVLNGGIAVAVVFMDRVVLAASRSCAYFTFFFFFSSASFLLTF